MSDPYYGTVYDIPSLNIDELLAGGEAITGRLTALPQGIQASSDIIFNGQFKPVGGDWTTATAIVDQTTLEWSITLPRPAVIDDEYKGYYSFTSTDGLGHRSSEVSGSVGR